MGVWNETCFITRMPIMSDDEVVMIVLKKDVGDLVYFHHPYQQIERIGCGSYNEYGWLKGLSGDHTPSMTDRPEPYQRSIFSLRKVWNQVLVWVDQKGRSIIESVKNEQKRDRKINRIIGEKTERSKIRAKHMEEWIKVLYFCYQCRIDPKCGLAFKGSQHWNLLAYQKMEDLIYDEWSRLKQWEDECREEE